MVIGSRARARRWLLLVALTVMVAAPVQALAGAQVPFKGADAGGFTFPAACGPTSLVVDIGGVGNATQVGRYAYEALECFDTDTLLYSGVFTLRAANGDTLSGTYSGEVVEIVGSVGRYEQDAVVTGGTGRFSGADGGFHVSGEADLASGEYTQELSGAISSPGSTK